MRKLIKKYAWLFVLIFILSLFPQSLSDQARLSMRVIITGIGIDYLDGQYQVTSQIVLPQNGTESGGISAHISYVSATAKTIADGVQRVSYKLGKLAELSHIEFILVGESMKEHNLASSLDYFFRNFKIKKSVMLLACPGEAKETIFKTSELELGVALSLQKIFLTNENSLNAVETSYVDFISQSHSTSSCCVLDTLVITSPEKQNSSSNSSQQESQSQNQANESSEIKTKSPLYLYKNGLFHGSITQRDEILGYYLSSRDSKTGNIYIQDFSFGEIQSANINVRVDNMNKQHSISFSNGKPVHTININLKEIKIDEIAAKKYASPTTYNLLDYSTQQAILQRLKDDIKAYINSTFVASQNLNFDIFQTADLANKFDNKKWQTFIQNLPQKDQYIKDVSVVVNVSIDRIT